MGHAHQNETEDKSVTIITTILHIWEELASTVRKAVCYIRSSKPGKTGVMLLFIVHYILYSWYCKENKNFKLLEIIEVTDVLRYKINIQKSVTFAFIKSRQKIQQKKICLKLQKQAKLLGINIIRKI